MMTSNRFSALLAYLPVIGWAYILLFRRDDSFAMFHLRQSIGLFAFLLTSLAVWAVITWLLSWIPFGFLIGVTLFTVVMCALFYGVVLWVIGIVNSLQGRMALLPIFGKLANRLLS